MRLFFLALVLAFAPTSSLADDKEDGPTSEKAQKTYKEAIDLLRLHQLGAALDDFKKADKQDGGHCAACQKEMIHYGARLGDWKTAELAAQEMITEAQDTRSTALAHYQMASVLMAQGLERHKDEFFARAHDELGKALAAYPNFPDAYYLDGRTLAQLRQDDAAKARFEQFAKMKPENDLDRQRALRYIINPQLARARMAPPFEVTTLDGQHLSMDELQGKVVLIDFWATWCLPCREAIPHIRDIARKFHDEPFVVLSVSLDRDESKWQEFVAKNEMTWPQYLDASSGGSMARMFGVSAIPHTFTVDADGIVQDERIGDESIEGKLKKLLTRARELQSARVEAPADRRAPTE